MRNVGYARVSTKEQNLGLQLDALRQAGCAKRDVYADEGISGKLAHRPELDKCLAALRPGDTLVIWKLDRLGRSLLHLVNVVNDLAGRGIGFKSLTESIDTTTNSGKLIFHIFAALAEFERGLIIERTMAGLRTARDKGHIAGRLPVLSAEQAKLARGLLADGKTVAEVARAFGVSRPTIYRVAEASEEEIAVWDKRATDRRKRLAGAK